MVEEWWTGELKLGFNYVFNLLIKASSAHSYRLGWRREDGNILGMVLDCGDECEGRNRDQ